MSVVSLPHPLPTNGRPGERLDNRAAGRRGRQIACAWRTWQGYYVRILSWSSLTSMFSGLLQKDLFKGKWSLAKRFFKQNYCHACHIRFAVFFPLPSCCVSSLLLSNCTLFSHQLLQVHSLILIGNEYKQRLVRFIENISHNSLS